MMTSKRKPPTLPTLSQSKPNKLHPKVALRHERQTQAAKQSRQLTKVPAVGT